MAQFILLLNETPGDFDRYSPEEMESIIGRYYAWRDELAGKGQLVSSHKLTDEGGRHMSRANAGQTNAGQTNAGQTNDGQTGGSDIRVVDGPYSEVKEVVGGLFIIEAEDYDAAVAISSGCPHLEFGTVSLRQIDSIH